MGGSADSESPGPGAAIIGAGFMGHEHARAIRAAGGRVVGVSASEPGSAERAVASMGARRSYGDNAELIGDPAVQVVHICAPNDVHAPAALAAVAAGKHVVCEKPLAMSAAAGRELVGEAARAGVLTAVPFVYRYYPMVREARALVQAGTLGELSLVHGSYLQDWLLGAAQTNWRVDSARGGASRAFADIGSHWCDLVEFVTGDRIEQLSARFSISHAERPVAGDGQHTFGPPVHTRDGQPVRTEDTAVASFQTAGGALGSLVLSQVAAGHKNHFRFEVSGLSGTATFDHATPGTLEVSDETGVTRRLAEPTAPSGQAGGPTSLPAGHPHGYRDCFEAFMVQFYGAVGGAAPTADLPRFEDGARAAELTEAALASARADGRWTAVGAPADHHQLGLSTTEVQS